MRLFRLGDTQIACNDWFIILLGIYLLLGVLPQALVLFLSVFLHEICHVLVARRLGWKALHLELFPFGGVALLQPYPGFTYSQEALIALAGLLSSFF